MTARGVQGRIDLRRGGGVVDVEEEGGGSRKRMFWYMLKMYWWERPSTSFGRETSCWRYWSWREEKMG